MALSIKLNFSDKMLLVVVHIMTDKTAGSQLCYKLFSKWSCKFKFGSLPLFSFVSLFIDKYWNPSLNPGLAWPSN